MRSIYFILVFILVFSVKIYSQSFVYAVHVGNAMELNVTGANGTIQWQQSTDSLSWSNISGATTSPYTFNAVASPSGNRFFRAAITNTIICQNAPWYSTVVKYRIVSSSAGVQLGDWYRGGIVYSLDGIGNGVIAPTLDQSNNSSWGCQSIHIPTAMSTTDGNANTNAIIANCTERPIAASVCYDLTLNGYTDWYLPAFNQLLLLSQRRAIVGNFVPAQNAGGVTIGEYWASTDNDFGYADFLIVEQDYQPWVPTAYKDMQANVRCVRSYTSSGIATTTSSTVYVAFQPETVSMISQPILIRDKLSNILIYLHRLIFLQEKQSLIYLLTGDVKGKQPGQG